MKLLIIDDNVEITEMLQEYFKLEDFEVTVVNDAKGGLELIQNGDFDKILLDMAMPEFSGFDIIKNLRRQFFKGLNKIIILTASEIDPEIKEKIHSWGIKEIVAKPIDMAALLEKLKNN